MTRPAAVLTRRPGRPLPLAIQEMAGRYGTSMQRVGLAFNSATGTLHGKSWEYWNRAGRRQYAALVRLARAAQRPEVW
ncbi:hypothetical protein QEZ54_35420 [Catellatospora sp. KI3]|uniref:hypothetical protein n=1 Tax=Catellatospora sp. KI3 TaxID=3041620 RepID=UPI0024824964|nr:hypothetical protein [Catellatospora sp. KI3]MDI1466281.1 hypothetical protein [Catellatospora sp. KI3]